MLKNYLKKFSYYLPFMLPLLIPFSRALADITIIIISLLFILHSYVNNQWEWTKVKWVRIACIFILYCIFIVTPLSINTNDSFLYSIYFLRWPLFSLALCFWILDGREAIKNFLLAVTIVVSFLIIDSWWQYFFDFDLFGNEKYSEDRLSGPFRRPHIGMWISKLSLFLPFLFLIQKKINSNISNFYFVFLIIFYTVFISGERMALILTLLSITIYSFGFYLNNYLVNKKIIIFFIFFILINIVFYFFDPLIYERSVVSTIDKIYSWKESDYYLVWESAYKVWMESPFVGSGFHTYREACDSLSIYTLEQKNFLSICFHPHNISLELLSELGFFGFILFYLMILFIFLEFKKTFKSNQWLLFSIYISIFIGCFFPLTSGMSIFSNKLASIIWLLVGFCLAYEKQLKKSNF